MDKPKITPKDFFTWFGAMIALYVSAFSFISLLFDYINYLYPDALGGYVDPYSGAMRFAIASLVVFFPIYLLLMRLIRSDITSAPEKAEIWIRRWAIYLTLFIGGLTLAGDLITLINTFLGGDLTTRFVLKVAVVFLVIGGVFLHFLAEMRGYWLRFPGKARIVGWSAGAAIVLAIAAGFLIMGTPGQIRQLRLDDQRVGDLQNIQYQVVNYWQQKQKLPAQSSDLEDPISEYRVPTDPVTGESYPYAATGARAFKLCATFSLPSRAAGAGSGRSIPAAPGGGAAPDNWTHGAGQVCFNRAIDPERYPPFTKQAPTL